jgi:SAM-dependent methyltransferase
MDQTSEAIQLSIKERYANLARCPGSERGFPIGPESAKSLGYPANQIDGLAESVTESFAGVGDPFSLGELHAGETVLDLGCGAGLDSIFASRMVGPSGTVIGVDFSPEMIDKAKRNAETLGLPNVEFRLGDLEALSLANATVDVAISNGVFNLCLDKPRVLAEIFRVLGPGGRLQMADMILEDHVTPEKVELMGSWSG